MARRLPYDRCAVCDRTLAETGGKRLVATASHAIRICNLDTPLGSLHHPARTIRLRGDFRDVIVVLSGARLWTHDAIVNVERIVYKGTRPWFCQRCAVSSLCPACETPLTTAPMTDHLEDDGRTVHSPHVAGYVRECPNPACEHHRTGVHDEDVTDWIDDIPMFDPELNRRVDEMLSGDAPE